MLPVRLLQGGGASPAKGGRGRSLGEVAATPLGSVQELWWSRTGIEPTDLLIQSGALPLSYGPVTKDAGTMHQCGSVSNQENGLAIVRGVSGAGPIGRSLAH